MATVTTAGEIMTTAPYCVRTTQSVAEAARLMRSVGVGALPVCGADDRLTGILTDRDIVIRGVAAFADLHTVTVGQIATPDPYTAGPDDSIEEVERTMAHGRFRRVPVVEDGTIIGIVSQADVASGMPPAQVGAVVGRISETGDSPGSDAVATRDTDAATTTAADVDAATDAADTDAEFDVEWTRRFPIAPDDDGEPGEPPDRDPDT